MSELIYKELQEQGVFDVPYRAFEFMQSQQAKIDAITKQRDSFIKAHHIAMNDVCEHKAKIDELQKQVITQGQNFNDQAQKLKDTEYFNQKLQARVDVYELHIKTLKNIHENDFNEESESSYILGNLDGFFECIEADLKGNKDEN